jgi:SM-20-related protein
MERYEDVVPRLEPELTPLAWQLLQRELEALRAALNAATLLGLHDFEGHYALYPAGASYARHVDNFRGGSDRLVSLVLYLNQDWTDTDGGELCLYPGEAPAPVRVAPQAGTLMCFLSEGMPHEVRPAKRDRLSLTGWFRRRKSP